MGAQAVVNFITALIAGVPKVIEAIKAGRDPKDIKLGDFVSHDALDRVKRANQKADDYIDNG